MGNFLGNRQIDYHRPGAMGGISGPCPPKSLLVPPKRKVCPPCEGCALKESNRPGATEVRFGACAPPKYCLWPLNDE